MDYQLYIDVSGRVAKVYFQPVGGDGERIQVKFNPQETALYTMMVKMTWSGRGLDWRENISSEDANAILQEYNKIYNKIANEKTVSSFMDRTQVNHIKNKLRAIQCVANIESFLPFHDKGKKHSYYKVPATKQDIHILE